MMLCVMSILREEWVIWKYLRGMRGCTKWGSVESEKKEVLRQREAEAGLPGGSRDLLSLQGGHAGNDTSAQ
jgi:hypothetical protein